jgi:phospholipid transport system substrate-binding protein
MILPVLCLGVLGTVSLAPVSLAQGSGQMTAPATTAPAAQDSGAAAPIAALYATLGQIEHSHGSFAERARMLAPSVDKAFDLQTVLQKSLGLRFRTIPADQKAALLDQFRQFTIARYVSNFAPGGTDVFKVDPATTASPIPGQQVVHTHITAGDATTDVNYVMMQGPSGWRTVDVLLNGNISQVAVQRADFGSSLESGDATSLIDSLKKKTQAFSTS